MKGTVPYLNWYNRIDMRITADCRIGNDLLLLEQKGYDTDFVVGPFRFEMTMAIFVRRGICRVMIDMTVYEVTAPCMVVVMSGHIFQFVDMSDDMESLTILMSRNFSESLFGEYGHAMQLNNAIVEAPVLDLSECVNVFDTYLMLLSDLVHSPLNLFKLEAARHLTLAMFYGYSYRLHAVGQQPKTKGEQLYQRFETLLRLNYIRERLVSFYASRLCVTPKYLSAAVKRQTGRTAQQCIDDYVVTECKALLLSTDMTIQQIADKMNFPSQSVFGKYFKRLVGISPRAYRNTTAL